MGVIDKFVSHEKLLQMSDADLERYDIGRLNLECAVGLRGAEGLDVKAMCRRLDEWAAQVRCYTDKMFYQFERNPQEFGSAGQFRILAMVTVLQRDLGVRYDPACMQPPFDFSDSRTEFIHGVLQGHGGTCVSLPVLYVAVGRRLGYPLHLCLTKEHCFVRWEGNGERFNIEATSRGFAPRPDEYYTTFPKPWTKAEERCSLYLKNLTRREEMAMFFRDRGHVLFDNGRLPEAVENFYHACQIQPDHPHALHDWAMGTMAIQIVAETERQGRLYGVSSHPLCKPPFTERWQKQMYPLTIEHLHRIARNQRTRIQAALARQPQTIQ